MLELKININQQVKLALIVVTLFVLASCQMLDLDSSRNVHRLEKFDTTTLQVELQKLDKLTISGLISVRRDGRVASANYLYSQDGNNFSIKLYGSFGIGSIEIKGDDSKAIFIDNKGKEIQAVNVENLMIQQFGWCVPIKGFGSWIKGVPVSDKKIYKQMYENNLTQILFERGWRINYRYYNIFDYKYPLPSNILMTRDNLYLKIIVKSWQI